jgi:drug/metabolite transporter (DMT)-like permease
VTPDRSSVGNDQRALGAAAVAAFVWGFGALIVRGVHAPASVIVFWRFALAQPVMLGAAYLSGGGLSWRLLRRTALPGVLFSTSMLASFLSYQKTSIVNASLIGSLQPALLLGVAPFVFGTRSTRRQLGFGLVALGGIAALVLGAGGTSGASFGGDAWAALNLVLWTVYFVLVQRIRDDGTDAASLLAAVFLMSFVVAAPMTLAMDTRLGSIGARGILLISLMALGPGLVGHGLMTWSQRHLDIRVTSLFGLGSPVVSTLGAWIIYSQRLRVLQVAGGVLVLVGLAGVVWEHRVNAPTKRPS